MSEIPSNLVETVNQIAADLDDIHFNSRHTSWIDGAKEIVVAALLAERQRCAGIALREGDKGAPAVGYVISQSILEGK